MLTIEQLKEQAAGKWFGILSQFGIIVDESGKHTACPICGDGGKGRRSDRFRMDVDGTAYFCNQCNPKAGDTLQLIKKVTGLEFPEIIKRISEMLGDIQPFKPAPKKDPSVALKKLWLTSKPIEPGDMAAQYLRSRKIFELPSDIRFCPECYNSDTKTKMPAMLGVFSNKDGKPISIHRTYLSDDKKADVPKPKKMLAGTESLAGGAVRLKSCADQLGIAEGIETALSAMAISGIPTWAALSTSLMESFVPPVSARKITIFADNDANFAGQKAAYHLANRLYNKPFELIVEVFVPKNVGDYNDELVELLRGKNE